jgi:hypothetical protein
MATSTSLPIFEAMTSGVTELHFDVTLTTSDGQPAADEGIFARVYGDGSFASGFDNKAIERESDAQGRIRLTWYRRNIVDRDAKADITVAPRRDDIVVSMQQFSPDKI